MKFDLTLLTLLVELAAAALARHADAAPGLAVVVHPSHRTLPLLEAAGSTAYVHLRRLQHQDFRVVRGGLPAAKERVCAIDDPEAAAALLARADLLLIHVPDDPVAVDAMPPFDATGRQCIVWGPARAAGWARLAPQLRGGDFTPIELAGARLLVSRAAIARLGGRQMLLPGSVATLAARVARDLPGVLTVEPLGSDGAVRLRIKPDPIQLIVAGTESLAHNLSQESRALFNARGIGSLALPLEGRGALQLLVRNVRDRIDGLSIAVGMQQVKLTRIDYTEYGAVLSLPPTGVDAGRDALMYLALPRSAVPGDGFCDIGAITQTLELA